MKNRGENVSGNHTVQIDNGLTAKVIFTQQLKPSSNPSGQCMIVSLLDSGGSRKKKLGGLEFSRCEGCGRDTAVVVTRKLDR